MPDTTPAEVRVASLECRAVYKEPIIHRWNRNGEIAQAVFRAFREWSISLEQVSASPFSPNLGQTEVTFQLLQGKFIFRVGLGAASLTVWNPVWPEMDTIGKIATAGVEAVRIAAQLELEKYEITLDIHLAPRGRTVAEVTRPFLPRALADAAADVGACGFIVHKNDSLWHVDSSAAFTDSLFLRLVRHFSPSTPISDMGAAVQAEEIGLLNVLGLSIVGL